MTSLSNGNLECVGYLMFGYVDIFHQSMTPLLGKTYAIFCMWTLFGLSRGSAYCILGILTFFPQSIPSLEKTMQYFYVNTFRVG